MNHKKFAVRVCALAVCLWGLTAAAGVVVEQEEREPGSQEAGNNVKFYLDAGRMRVESQTDEGNMVIIFLSEKQVAWMINTSEGTYTEITPAEMEKMGQQMSQAQKQMAEAMKNMSPEEREMMQKMMGQMGGMPGMQAAPEPATVRVVGRGETVGKFTCTHYQVDRSGKRESEVWAAPLDALQVRPEEFKTLADFAKLFEPLGRNLPMGQMSQVAKADKSGTSIEGFPVRTLTYVNGRPVSEEVVTRAERQNLDAGLFTLPSGLRKTAFGPQN